MVGGFEHSALQAHDNSYHHKRCQFYEPCNEPPKLEKNCPVCQATGVPCLRPPQAHAARRAEINQRALGLEVKHLREFLEQSDGALVTERTELLVRCWACFFLGRGRFYYPLLSLRRLMHLGQCSGRRTRSTWRRFHKCFVVARWHPAAVFDAQLRVETRRLLDESS